MHPASEERTMLAALLEAPEHMVVRRIPVPDVPPGGLLLRVMACGICGSDLRTLRHGTSRFPLPQVLGHEIVGVVARVGAGCREWQSGQRVGVAPPKVACGTCPFCLRGLPNLCPSGASFGYQVPGGFAQYMAVPGQGLAQGIVQALPSSLSDDAAVLLEPLSCCLRSQRRMGVGPGTAVVVLGGGPVGALHVRLALHQGAAPVILSEERASRRRRAVAWGAHRVVDPGAEDLKEVVRSLTGGWGADAAVVACSSSAAQQQALELVRSGGFVDLFAGLAGHQSPLLVDTNRIHYRETTLVGTHGAGAPDARRALELLASGHVRADDMITHREPLDRIREAFQAAHTEDSLVVVVRPWG